MIIAGAGGAAHLPGMTAAKTTLPVIGVPVQSKALNGMDSSFHRPNAWRRACCDNIHRQSGCCERRPVSGANFVSI